MKESIEQRIKQLTHDAEVSAAKHNMLVGQLNEAKNILAALEQKDLNSEKLRDCKDEA